MEKYEFRNIQTGDVHYLTIDNIIRVIREQPDIEYLKIVNGVETKINNRIVCNTQFICHRINTISELKNIPTMFGIELDLRDNNGDIIVTHDPFTSGESFCEYIQHYKHSHIILNIKSERIEPECLRLLDAYDIRNYFFLDSSFPMIYQLNQTFNNSNIACRFSEYEPIENYIHSHSFVKWVWVDCFNQQPLDECSYKVIQNYGGKICIVSPELQSQPNKIIEYRDYFIQNEIVPNAICCKYYNIIHWI